MNWQEFLMAALQAFAFLLGLTLLYRTVFRRESPRPWVHIVLVRTRLIAYFCIFTLSAILFIHQWSSLSGREMTLRIAVFIGIALLGILIVEGLSALIYDYILIEKRKASVPALFRDLVRGGVYLLLFGLFFWGILHIDIMPLLTTSAIITIIIGLALQDTLGNVFSGLALHLSRPFSIGDWIKAGEHEGKVVTIDWRSTTIKTLSSDYVVMPNSSVSKLDLQNYSSPTTEHARIVTVGAHYRHAPNSVCDALEAAALSAEGVIAAPPPKVWVAQYGDSSISYELKFWLDDFSRHKDIESQVMKQIWYHFKRANITIPFPIRTVYHHKETDARADILSERDMLSSIDFFKNLSDDEFTLLAQRLRHDIYPRGEFLFNQGDPGERFYIVKSGSVLVTVQDAQGVVLFSTTMNKGSCFGEMSLLTGEPRSATVMISQDAELLSLGKSDLVDLMARNAHLDETICDIVAERQMRTQSQLSGCEGDAPECRDSEEGALSLRDLLLRRIRSFFSY